MNELTQLLTLCNQYERARSPKVKLVAKLAAGKIVKKQLTPTQIKNRRTWKINKRSNSQKHV